MARRRRGIADKPPGLFDEAIRSTHKLQRNYTLYHVQNTATLKDFTDWVFEPDQLERLQWSFNHCEQSWYGSSAYLLPCHIDRGEVSLTVNCREMGLATPKAGTIKPQRDMPASLISPVQQVSDIYRDFNTVVAVLAKFNEDKWTYGAALHYFSHVRALFPSSHAIHQLAGGSFREPQNVGPLLQSIRDAQALLTDALLLPTDIPSNDRKMVTLNLPAISFGLI